MTERERALEVINKVIARSRMNYVATWVSDKGAAYDVSIPTFTHDPKWILIEAMKDLGFGDLTKVMNDG